MPEKAVSILDNCEQFPRGEPGRHAGGENLHAMQAELSHRAAIRDIGKMALEFVMADVGAYENWHLKKYGVKPELRR